MTAVVCTAFVALSIAWWVYCWRDVAVEDSAYQRAIIDATHRQVEASKAAIASDARSIQAADRVEAYDRRLRAAEAAIAELTEGAANQRALSARIAHRVGMT